MRFTRRDMLRLSLMAGGATLLSGRRAFGTECFGPGFIDPFDAQDTGLGVIEVFPTSPFILDPWTQPLPVPTAMKPGWRDPDGKLVPGSGVYGGPYPPGTWTVRKSVKFGPGFVPPGPGVGQQDALGERPRFAGITGPKVPDAGTHQLWTSGAGTNNLNLGYPDPILYHIRLQVSTHKFTTSRVVNIDVNGIPVALPPGATPLSAGNATWVNGATVPAHFTPDSVIYGFNGTFPGPLINAEYGHPALVRFENDLDLNPDCLDRQDFGAPDWAFLTHLHNGHTAPESDGQPHHMTDHGGGYQPSEWSDNLYLLYPAGGLDAEKQSFLWFHDHRMHHTGANVYKGMVGLMPHYDPILDNGDETQGLRLPGVRTDHGDGTFDVDYDIPMAFYDCRLDDGVTQHQDFHNGHGEMHPEWWGKTYFRHFPNHGFVGDVFTINGVAFPTLTVKRRKYRLRFLDASVARQYELSFRQGTVMPFPGQQGQYNFGAISNKGKRVTVKGTTVMLMTQIASEGGLLPTPIVRDSLQIWPAKRREVIVDFSKYRDGSPTTPGDVIYLTNTLQMLNGRKASAPGDPGFDSGYAVPMLKIIIDGIAPDNSVLPIPKKTTLRPAPFVNFNATKVRDFTLQRGGTAGGETEWLINGLQFDPTAPLATPQINAFEAWGINNGGGGWTHPMHLHMEEHHVLSRSSSPSLHPDDTGKEDVVALEGSEQTVIYRGFRTFLGNYVAHCHNLAHEDHNMMFGWSIVP